MWKTVYLLIILAFSTGIISCTNNKIAPQPLDDVYQVPLLSNEEEHPIALNFLPNTSKGYVDWVAAVRQGVIRPKETLTPNEEKMTMPAIDFNVYFKVKEDVPDVIFPHKPHTEWLDCRNCHPEIFKMQAGTNPVTMEKILQGEFCGRCHGKVAFPISDCTRCHSVPKK